FCIGLSRRRLRVSMGLGSLLGGKGRGCRLLLGAGRSLLGRGIVTRGEGRLTSDLDAIGRDLEAPRFRARIDLGDDLVLLGGLEGEMVSRDLTGLDLGGSNRIRLDQSLAYRLAEPDHREKERALWSGSAQGQDAELHRAVPWRHLYNPANLHPLP